MAKVNINKDWLLQPRPIDEKEWSDMDKWGKRYTCDVPCDVSEPLIKSQDIPDPVIADNCYKNEWIEDRSWWFQKAVNTDMLPDWEGADSVELVFLSLDHEADIFLNGAHLASHKNCHYEFRKNIKRLIKKGDNLITVRLTSGLETIPKEELFEVDNAICTEEPRRNDRGDIRRAFLRKPQYVYGWDWSPRAVTIGIADDVYIEISKTARITDVHIYTERIESNYSVIRGEIEVENMNILSTLDAEYIRLNLTLNNEKKVSWEEKDVFLCSGLNYLPFEIKIENPHLWWPNNSGHQPLYKVNCEMMVKNRQISYPQFDFGIRTIELDTSRINDDRRDFKFKINGYDIFAKGANWVPSDPLYIRVDDDRLERIIKEAADANMNILRIWGGAVYNRKSFYTLCDKYGLLVWQDFMFACSAYPDSLEWFMDLCEKEIDYQTKRLRNHACLALFCGNNECHEIFSIKNFMNWDINPDYSKQYGLSISNNLARKITHRNCPHIPYWNSSPYGGDIPQSSKCGDVHYWNDAMMSTKMENRITLQVYDKVSSAFVSEYGYIGPTCRKTIEQYHGDCHIEKGSFVWNLHNNTMEKDTVDAGIKKHYTDKELTLDEYITYAQMVQYSVLNYSLEAFRFSLLCNGGIFWMFNDCWGEVGWTVLDYYLRRKASYYGVKRAFEPVKIIIRLVDNTITAVGINETDKDMDFTAKTGWITFDGTRRETANTSFSLPKRSRQVIYTEKMQKKDLSEWIFAIIPRETEVSSAILNIADACERKTTNDVEILKYENNGDDLHVYLKTKGFVHGIYFEEDYNYSDNYFDMLPDETKKVIVYGAKSSKLLPKTVVLEHLD